MTLTDAGPLVALIDAGEPDHELCVLTVRTLTLPMTTTWPALAEAMYLLGRVGVRRVSNIYRLHGRTRLEVIPS